MEINKIHFILPPGKLLRSRLAIIKQWMKANPTKKIYIWHDSLADAAEFYFDEVFDNLNEKTELDANQKLSEFRRIMYESEYKYIVRFGGAVFVEGLFKKYREIFLEQKDLQASLKSKEAYSKMFDEFEKEMNRFAPNANEKEVKKILSEDVKTDVIKNQLNKDARLEIVKLMKRNFAQVNEMKKFDYSELIDKNVEIKDLYEDSKLFDKNLTSLYYFEILCNRDITLARNIAMYMISNKYRADLIMRPDILPAFGEGLESLPIGTVDQSKIYTSFSEAEATVNYLLFPNETPINIAELLNLIYVKRFNQIQLFSLNVMEASFLQTIDNHPDYQPKNKTKLKAFLKKFHGKILEIYGTDGALYARRLMGNSSNYQNHISEVTGTEFWTNNTHVNPESVMTLDNVGYTWPMTNKRPIQSLLENIQDSRMHSNFSLDIFVYFHSCKEYLTYSRYPSYNKKAILFAYENRNSEKIQFKETGIVQYTGERLEETGIREYVRDIGRQGRKIRIQVFGHSAAEKDGEKQTVGELEIEQFNDLFNNWFKEYLEGVTINRLVFVSCELAKFKNIQAKDLEFLPEGTFLEQFVKNFKSKSINIKQITASDKVISNQLISGRLFRVVPEGDIDKVRKILINTEKRFPDKHGVERYKCKPIEYTTNLTKDQILSNRFGLSENIFDASSALIHREVLEIPLQSEHLSEEIVKFSRANIHGNRMLEADAVALVACAQDYRGRTLIIDTLPQRLEAVRLALRTAVITNDFILWKTFIKSYFPTAYEYLNAHITAENFNKIIDNVFSVKIVFANCDLSQVETIKNITNYLEIETGASSFSLISVSNQENVLSKRLITEQVEKIFPIEDENFATTNEGILERVKSISEHFRDNVKDLMEEGTILVRIDDINDNIQLLDRIQMDGEWQIRSNTPLELMSREATHAETFADAYYMARELQIAYQDILLSNASTITVNHVPAFDTLVEFKKGSEIWWKLSFIDSMNLEHPAVTAETRAPIFKRVSNFVRNITVNHFTTTSSAALNLYFGINALRHWIENGFMPQTQGISNKSLATAIEVHFYVNAVGLIQGLAETAGNVGVLAFEKAIESTLLINALKPYVQMSMYLFKASTTGRILLSLGRFTSKALPVIGFIINAADLSFNVYELIHNNDPYQRPTIITNTVFSAAGFAISTAATLAVILGASAVAGPLALVVFGIALIYIPVSILVERFTRRIEGAKDTGLMVKSIVEEIRRGAYRKEMEHKFLAAPSFVPIKELSLSSTMFRITFGKNEYQRTSGPNNQFTYFYHPQDEFKDTNDQNCANIQIGDGIRALVMPHIPGYTFKMLEETVPYSSGRDDAEFQMAKDLQKKDSGFEFLKREWLGLGDRIADKFTLDYEHSTIDINIEESDWKLIFPWQDTAQATNDENRDLLQKSNEEIAGHLKKISYRLNSKIAGRQTISLPALQCPIDMHLNSMHDDVIWFIEFIERSVSNKEITISKEDSTIKIGGKQNIKLHGKIARIYINVPKYQNSENNYDGLAYFDVKENRYIYNKDATEKEQGNVNLLFATNDFAYFYLHDQSSADNSTGIVWCVSNSTHKLIVALNGIKMCQRQRNGLVLINNDGIIYHIDKDLKTQGIASQVIGFTEAWFNRIKNPKKALEEINAYFEKNPHITLVNLYLPYRTADDKMSKTANILFYPEKQKYFILDSKYVKNSNPPKFLKFDKFDEDAYYYADAQQDLIIVKGMNIDEISGKLQIIHDKTVINTNEPCEILLKGVSSAVVAGIGVEARLSCGLAVLIHQSPADRIKMKIQKLILDDDFENQHDKNIQDIFQDTNMVKNEHLGDNFRDKIQIYQTTFVSIIHMGKTIGFFETIKKRALCIAKLPNAHSIRPLGTDNLYAYDILDYKKIYRSQWVSYLSEIRNGPKNHVTPTEVLFEADAIELYDETLFLKKDAITGDFSNILKTISNLPEIGLIRLESKKYTLKFDIFENVSISSIDLSMSMIDIDIELHIENAKEYYLERQNFDMYFYSPRRNSAFIFKGVFKTETTTAFLGGVVILAKSDQSPNVHVTFNLPDIIYIYEQYNDIIYASHRKFYAKLCFMDIMTNDSVKKSHNEIETLLKTLLWPNQNDEKKIYGVFERINSLLNMNEKSRSIEYLFKYFKEREILDNLIRSNKQSNILHSVAKSCMFGRTTIPSILKCFEWSPLEMKKFVLMNDKEGKTFLHFVAICEEPQIIAISLSELTKHLGVTVVKQLVLRTDEHGEHILHYAISKNKIRSVEVLMREVKKHLGTNILTELVTATCGSDNKNILHLAVTYAESSTFEHMFVTLNSEMGHHLEKDTFKNMLMATYGPNRNILHIAILNGNIEIIKILFEKILYYIGKDKLKELLTTEEILFHDILQFTTIHGKPEIMPIICDEIENKIGVDFLKRLMMAIYENNNDILELAIYNGKFEIIPSLLKEINDRLKVDVLKYFMLKRYPDDINVLFDAALADHPDAIPLLFHEVKFYLGSSALEKLILETDINGENILQFTIFNNKYPNISVLFKEIKDNIGEHILKHLVLKKTEEGDENILQYAVSNNKDEAFEILLRELNNHLGRDALIDLVNGIDSENYSVKLKNMLAKYI